MHVLMLADNGPYRRKQNEDAAATSKYSYCASLKGDLGIDACRRRLYWGHAPSFDVPGRSAVWKRSGTKDDTIA